MRHVLHDAAAPPAGLRVARRPAGEPARDRARLPRDDRPSALGGDLGGPAGASRRHDPLRRRAWERTREALSRHRLWRVAVDAGLVALAWYLAFQVRFDKGVPARYDEFLGLDVFVAVVAINLVVFVFSASTSTGGATSPSATCGGRCSPSRSRRSQPSSASSTSGTRSRLALPRGIIAIDWLFALAFVSGARVLARTMVERAGRGQFVARRKEALIVGAGDAGQMIIREMLKSPQLGYTPIGLVDDGRARRTCASTASGCSGRPIRLPRLPDDNRPDEVIIAIPSGAGEVRQTVVNACRDAGVPVKTLPGVHELIAGDLNLSGQLREVQVEDVLGREAVELDIPSIASYITGATVLVTGAGGSIGSELCRQVAALGAEPDHARRSLRERSRGRSSASSSASATTRPPCPRSPTSRTPARFGASSSATARRSSSTPPPTSTSR